MLRNLFRTSRWLAHNRIDIFAPVLIRHISRVGTSEITYIQSNPIRNLSASPSDKLETSEHIEPAVFEDICNETLESLCEYFEEIIDQSPNLKGADVTYSDGVLTISLGSQYGTYVINRQTPNKQIWLSSPVSGPKRYDLVLKDGGYWIYKHDSVALHKLLQDEISKIVDIKITFNKCAHSLV
ncbi:unnamed protein product [Chilo suppressalis]|uniref:ferroxidase n=1 Tax=Chilo suppressalis TaxID=168631 RepID=A0ABN8BFL5_CHISP|nr:unnamed protein product [Chilo suppressalis]